MPHNLFLHSEIIQSRHWNLKDKKLMEKQLRFEFVDTLFSMSIGWAINSAMILLAAATFFVHGVSVSELQQAQELLVPLLGANAAHIFAIALLFCRYCFYDYGRYGRRYYFFRYVRRTLRYEGYSFTGRAAADFCPRRHCAVLYQ